MTTTLELSRRRVRVYKWIASAHNESGQARFDDIRDRLEEIGVPTLIVWGRNDRVVPVPAALSYKKRIGDNAELVIFNHCGHVLQMERPVRFNRLLERFLSS